jgi:hypothetical protein
MRAHEFLPRSYAAGANFDYYQIVMATMAPASPAKIKKTPSPESKETAQQTPVPECDEIVKPGSLQSHPEHDAVARLAYIYWLDRKDTGEGSPDQDWLRAEEELRGNLPAR